VLLEAVLKIHLLSKRRSEQRALLEAVPNLQQACIQHQELLLPLVLAIRQFHNSSRTSELHLHLETEPQITQLFIQISERHMVLVRPLLAIRQQVCIPHRGSQQAVDLVLRHLKKKQRCLGLRQLMVSVHQHQANCVQFIELVPQSVNLIRFHHSDTENSEQPMGMVGRQLTMKHSSFIPQSEPQAEMVMALQPRLRLRLL
jgi:hypothetical protein